jgi:hypothetical protein
MSKTELMKTSAGVPAVTELPEYLKRAIAHGGRGVSTDARDNTVPMIYLLQKSSKQVDPSDPAYDPAARPGYIWLKGHGFVPGDQGVLVQPCYFWKEFKEWIPRSRNGGGLAGTHAYRIATERDAQRRPSLIDFGPGDRRGAMPAAGRITPGEEIPDVEDAIFTLDPSKNRILTWARRDKGDLNELVFTRSHAVRVFVGPDVVLNYVIPLKSTGLQVSRDWMTLTNSRRIGGRIPDSWTFLYRLTTMQKSRAGNSWYIFVPQWIESNGEHGAVSDEDYLAGEALFQSFDTGARVAEEEILTEGSRVVSDETPKPPQRDEDGDPGYAGAGDPDIPF